MSTSTLFPEMFPPVQAGLTFPITLCEKYRPLRIADFVGLNGKGGVKALLSSFVTRPRDCGMVFCGPSGTGKTTMALALATEIRALVHRIPAQTCNLETVAAISHTCRYYPPAGYTKHLVIVDEADLMSVAAQNALLSKLDDADALPDTIWIFTCNSTERLTDRFLSRNRIMRFTSNAMAPDAALLLERIWDAEKGSGPKPNFRRIVKDANNNVRTSLNSLENELEAA